MASIIDYAIKNANKDFEKMPFNHVDALVFAQLSYLFYDGIVPNEDDETYGVTFAQIAEAPDELYESMFPLERTRERNKMLLNAVAYSKRYGKIRVNYYVNNNDAEKETQFSAVTFINELGKVYIVFRGTDATITGWRENFNMLYTSPVASQILSVPYVEKVAQKTSRKITLIGHSKGGNLAIYAGVNCQSKIKSRIGDIISFDNPGFTEEFINSKKYTSAVHKIHKYVPEQSMVGMLLSNKGTYTVVKSEGEGFYQHDPFMWIINNNEFEKGDGVATHTKMINFAFNDWVFGFTPSQRETFINAFFLIVEQTNRQNANTFGEWSENLKDNVPLVLDALKGLDSETKSLMLKVFGQMFVSAKDGVTTTQKKIIKKGIKKIPGFRQIKDKKDE